MILNLRELQAFKAIAELGSLGKAADALNLTQPALTRTLKRLEHQLGVSLFERHAHGTTLTEYGRALEPHASLMLAESLNATRELREMLGQERGVVRVGTVASAVENFLPEAIARLTAERPGLQVQIVEGLADTLAVQLAKGDVDLVIGFAMPQTEGVSLVLASEWQEGCHIVCAADHPLRAPLEDAEDPALGPVVVSAEQIAARIAELGKEITRDYAGRSPLLVGVLKGAFVFMSDLSRAIDLPVEFDFMAVSSYGSATRSSGVVRIIKDLDLDLTGRHVLIVEDIVDSGLTLAYLRKNLMARGPAGVADFGYVDKPDPHSYISPAFHRAWESGCALGVRCPHAINPHSGTARVPPSCDEAKGARQRPHLQAARSTSPAAHKQRTKETWHLRRLPGKSSGHRPIGRSSGIRARLRRSMRSNRNWSSSATMS